MRILLVLVMLVVSSSAFASQEQIHSWKSATVSASTTLFGDVDVRATADVKGNVQSVEVITKAGTLAVPAKWLATLPAMPLASLEIRTERGYDPDPWLYVVFRTGTRTSAGAAEVHIAFQSGKLKEASIETFDGKGGSKRTVKPAP